MTRTENCPSSVQAFEFSQSFSWILGHIAIRGLSPLGLLWLQKLTFLFRYYVVFQSKFYCWKLQKIYDVTMKCFKIACFPLTKMEFSASVFHSICACHTFNIIILTMLIYFSLQVCFFLKEPHRIPPLRYWSWTYSLRDHYHLIQI